MSSRKNWGPKKELTDLERDRLRRKKTQAGRKGGLISRSTGNGKWDARKSGDDAKTAI